MMALTEHTNQILQSSDVSCTAQQPGAWSKRKNASIDSSGFDLLFSALTSAPHLNPALQQTGAQGQDVVHKPCNTPKDTTPPRKDVPAEQTKPLSNDKNNAEGVLEERPVSEHPKSVNNDTIVSQQSAQAGQSTTLINNSVNSLPPTQNMGEQLIAGIEETTTAATIAQAVQTTTSGNNSANSLPTPQTTTAQLINRIDETTIAQTAQTISTSLDNSETLLGKQRLEQQLVSLPKSAPISKDIPSLQFTTNTPGADTEPPSQIQPTGNNTAAPAEPKAATQVADTQRETLLKDLVSSIKQASLAGSPDQDTPSFQAGAGSNRDASPFLNNDQSGDFALTGDQKTSFSVPTVIMEGPQGKTVLRAENASQVVRIPDDPNEIASKVYITRDGNKLAVTLRPEGLGKLDINLSLDRGLVNAQIHVTDPAVKNLIESNLQQLVHTLMHEGLNVDGFSVSLKNNGAGDGTGQEMTAFLKQSGNGTSDNIGDRVYDQNGRISIFV